MSSFPAMPRTTNDPATTASPIANVSQLIAPIRARGTTSICNDTANIAKLAATTTKPPGLTYLDTNPSNASAATNPPRTAPAFPRDSQLIRLNTTIDGINICSDAANIATLAAIALIAPGFTSLDSKPNNAITATIAASTLPALPSSAQLIPAKTLSAPERISKDAEMIRRLVAALFMFSGLTILIATTNIANAASNPAKATPALPSLDHSMLPRASIAGINMRIDTAIANNAVAVDVKLLSSPSASNFIEPTNRVIKPAMPAKPTPSSSQSNCDMSISEAAITFIAAAIIVT